jgi:hypothetical protein
MEREDIEHLIDYARSSLAHVLQDAIGYRLPLPRDSVVIPTDPPVNYVPLSESISDALTTGNHCGHMGVGAMLSELSSAVDNVAVSLDKPLWREAYIAALPQCIQMAATAVNPMLSDFGPRVGLDPVDTAAIAEIACDLADRIADLSMKKAGLL